jgi:hypothetical protein
MLEMLSVVMHTFLPPLSKYYIHALEVLFWKEGKLETSKTLISDIRCQGFSRSVQA